MINTLELRSINSLDGLLSAQSRAGFLRSFLMSDAPDEEWRPVPNWEMYFVSNKGRVKSRGKILKPGIDTSGYKHHTFLTNKTRYTVRVHKLVMETFIGPCPKDMVRNHIDRNKINNNVDNLEYCSMRENSTNTPKNRYTGVYKHKNSWKMSFRKGAIKFSKQFRTEEEAARHYKKVLADYGVTNKYARLIED